MKFNEAKNFVMYGEVINNKNIDEELLDENLGKKGKAIALAGALALSGLTGKAYANEASKTPQGTEVQEKSQAQITFDKIKDYYAKDGVEPSVLKMQEQAKALYKAGIKNPEKAFDYICKAVIKNGKKLPNGVELGEDGHYSVMNVWELSAKQTVKEEIKPAPKGKKGCLVVDIDDTLLSADTSVIGIWKHKPGEEPKRLTPDQFAKDPDSEHEEWYDYKEFRDPEKVYQSIVKGTPILRNLKLMDAHMRAEWDLAFLTARGLQDVVDSALRAFLKTRTKEGELIPIGNKLKKDISAGVNDASWEGVQAKTPERKAMVLKNICKKYDYVKFVDDDVKNVNFVKGLKIPNLQVIKAQV